LLSTNQPTARVAYVHGSVLRQVTKSKGDGAALGVFCAIDNALYSIAVRTHTKMAEAIDMPFGMMSGLGPMKSVLCGGDIPEGEGATLGKTWPTNLKPVIIATLATKDRFRLNLPIYRKV